MLKLCEPFLDASSSKKDKLDIQYVLRKGRLDFRLETVSFLMRCVLVSFVVCVYLERICVIQELVVLPLEIIHADSPFPYGTVVSHKDMNEMLLIIA